MHADQIWLEDGNDPSSASGLAKHVHEMARKTCTDP